MDLHLVDLREADELVTSTPAGIATLRELVVNRPPLRTQTLALLLDLTTFSGNVEIRSATT